MRGYLAHADHHLMYENIVTKARERSKKTSVPRAIGSVNMFLKKCHDPLPGVLRCRLVVITPLIVEERVLRARIDFDIVRDVIAIQFYIKLLSLCCRKIFVRIGANDGAEAGDSLQWTRIRAIVRSNGLEPIVGAGPGDGESAAHTEADGSQFFRVHAGLLRQECQGLFKCMNTRVIERDKEHLAHETKHTDSTIAPCEEVNRQSDIADIGEALGNILDILGQAKYFVNNDDTWKWPLARGTDYISSKLCLARCERDSLSFLCHRYLLIIKVI